MRSGVLGAAIVAAWALSAGALLAAEGLQFEDKMEALGLASPGFGWYGYHDAIVCADWDGDGDVDVLVRVSPFEKSPKGDQARLYVNKLVETGKLAFQDETDKLLPGGIAKDLVADGAPFFFDVDSDGDLDICSISDEHAPYTFLNDKGVFRMEKWGFNAQSCVIRDVNGDGLPDVLGTDTGMLYLNEGAGKFKAGKTEGDSSGHMPRDKVLPTPPGITVDEEARAKAASPEGHVYFGWRRMDLDGDGQEDYMLSLSMAYGFKLSRFYVKAGSEYKDFTAETGLPTTTQLHFADVDGDGLTDAVSSGPKDAGVFLGDGKGRFRKVDDPATAKLLAITTGGCYTAPQAVADFDGDGKLDILTWQYRVGGGSALLRGLGEGRFEKVLATGASSGQAYADLDNDGLLDIVCSGPQKSQGLHVWINKAPATSHWLKVRVAGPSQNPFAVTAEIEAFAVGADPATAKPLARGVLRSDGLPVHLGLGSAEKVDLRIRLGGKVVKDVKAAASRQLLNVTLD